MKCLACVRTCQTGALRTDEKASCTRLTGNSPLKFERDKCNKCGKCKEICPMGNIVLSLESCNFCIICNSKPLCVLDTYTRTSLFTTIISSIQFVIFLCIYKIRYT